ncbi:MAG TPA: MG2 domain-containing protein, partial [Pyrinomonadaceae bacterium]|nr:MG2 domain-containing protein [Pyrinomonadaceae bacterium]
MKTIISLAAFLFLLFQGLAQQVNYPQQKADAERAYSEGSYARANQIYSQVNKTPLPEAEARWVEFRIADTLWRAQSATETADNTKYEEAQKQLGELIRVKEKEEDRDLVWAEAHESLGDFFWLRRDQNNWGGGWPHYQLALDWWAGQRDIQQARDRYLRIVFKAADAPKNNNYYYYTYYGNYIPLPILENALKISESESEKTHLHFLIAMTLRNSAGDWESRDRVSDEFEVALKAGKKSDWYDDALYHYAEWTNNYGTLRQLQDGQWEQVTDYSKAIELYQRLLHEFQKGETRYYDQAQQQIKSITDPALNIGVSNIFLPTSELQFVLNARNVGKVSFALYRIDLTRDVRFTRNAGDEDGEAADENMGWVQRLPTAGREVIKSWTKELPDKGEHRPFGEQLRIDAKLPVGAYLLEATSGNLSSRDLVLVTDASLVVKTTPRQAVAFFTNAMSGAPIANATVALWESYYQNNKWHWRKLTQTTNNDGLTTFALKQDNNSRGLFVAAAGGANNAQAFSGGYANYTNPGDGWRIYAFTDRPAYRPKETVQWKFIARRLNGGAYTTPVNQVVEYQINDPRGNKVSEGKATLNSFGSAWSSFELGDQLPLGAYNVQFWDQGRSNGIGGATLFQLEEYKLPEFKVTVKTPDVDGRKKSFRLGEKVEANIQADYYFGGPVSNASVEVVVYQRPFYHYWFPYREYPWYYDDIEQSARSSYYYGGPGQVIKREVIKTDVTGKATLSFDTPRENYNQDFEFRIEARVTDSSRREIVAADNVRVTRQRYYVYPKPQGNIYRPKDKITVDIKAIDANEQPVATTGTVKITRDYWWEVWLDPNGREVKGEELRLLRE